MTDGQPEDVSYDKPVPRDPKSPAKVAQIRVHNRRREYLQRHPSYYESLDHELADPVLYERLVKHFQSASERTAEGKAKGYGLTLEASLLRGESTLANLKESVKSPYAPDSSRHSTIDNPWDATALNKEHGLELWRGFLEDRFVKGDDSDFDYDKADKDDTLDTLERGEAEDRWFNDEEPSWVGQDQHDKGVERTGETGVQDF